MSTADASPSLETGTWKLDTASSSVEFHSRSFWGLMPVRGKFAKYDGSLDLSATPAMQLVVDAASLDTKNAKRDEHLRSDDFFGAATHPEVRFEATEVHPHGDHLHITGTLTAGGHSITVEPAAHVRPVEGGYEIDAVVVVNHRELGMTTNPAGMIRPTSKLAVRGKLVQA